MVQVISPLVFRVNKHTLVGQSRLTLRDGSFSSGNLNYGIYQVEAPLCVDVSLHNVRGIVDHLFSR